MVIDILGDKAGQAYAEARRICVELGHTVTGGSHFVIDLTIAPLLTTKLSEEELAAPRIGTLIFHPSPLPWGRGAASIRHAYKRGEPITAATWFWANDRYDAGDICEQEIIAISHEMRPREFYEAHIIPAMGRTLERALMAIERGYIRAVPQVEEYSSYD